MTTIRPDSCPICRGDCQPAFMAGEHRMYRCRTCSTSFAHPVPTDEQLERFYGLTRLMQQAGFDVRWLDKSFERSTSRRTMSSLRNLVAAAAFRAAATISGLKETGFVQARFPLGNHMYAAERK